MLAPCITTQTPTTEAVPPTPAAWCRRAGWPAAVARAWRRRGIRHWTPLQLAAWQAGVDRDTADWLVAAPTSAGKSLVAEAAALHHLLRGEQVIWLAPTRALARSLADQLAPLLGRLGLRLAVATGEHPDPAFGVERGDFDLLVAVYEKALHWLVRWPEGLARVGLLIADELGMLRDPQRGPRLDILLTMAARSPYAPRRLGLCAPGGEARAIAPWWGGRLLEHAGRPRPLHEGVFDAADATFHWRARPGGESGTEPLAGPDEWQGLVRATHEAACAAGLEPTPQLVATLAAAVLLARRGEPTLLFAPTRRAAREWAGAVAALLPPVATACAGDAARLARNEPCTDHDQLAYLLACGVACHHGDLSAAARRLAETAFQRGDAVLMVATATLAHGLNLTARNVVQWPQGFIGDARGRLLPSWLERWRWHQQGGRAARLGLGEGTGRTFAVAGGAEEHTRLWRRYVLGTEPPMRGRFDARSAEMLVLAGLAGGAARTRANLAALARATFAGSAASSEACAALIDEAAAACVREGLIAPAGEVFRLSALGELCAAHGIDAATWRQLASWIDAAPTFEEGSDLPDPDRLLPAIWGLALAVPPGGLPTADARGARAEVLRCAKWFARRTLEPPPALARLLKQPDAAQPAEAAALRAGRMLACWIGPEPTPDVEAHTGWPAGMLRHAGKGLCWLAHVVAETGRLHGWPRARSEAWRSLGVRLATGAPSGAEDLARIAVPEPGRATLRRLASEGILTRAELAGADVDYLATLLGDAGLAAQLHAAASGVPAPCGGASCERGSPVEAPEPAPPAASVRRESPPVREMQTPAPAGPLLEIDLASPGIVRAAGRELTLPPLGWDLLAELARAPGRVVTRQALCPRLWPDVDTAPQPQQLDAHRRRVLQRLAPALNGRADGLIEVVRGIGFRLNLESSMVLVRRD